MLETIRPLLGRARFDWACFTEDLAYRSAPHVPPANRYCICPGPAD